MKLVQPVRSDSSVNLGAKNSLETYTHLEHSLTIIPLFITQPISLLHHIIAVVLHHFCINSTLFCYG